MKTETISITILSIIIIFLLSYIFLLPQEKQTQKGESNTIQAEQNQVYDINFKDEAVILEESDIFTAQAKYPITGKEFIDFDFKELILESLKEFQKNANANADYPPIQDSDSKYYFDASYSETQNSDIVKSYIFTIDEYSGGAHGMQNIISKTYNLEDQEMYTIEDILVNGSADLPQIAEISREKIKEDLTSQGIEIDENMQQMILDGTSYDNGSANFETFGLNKDSITFYFTPYQVAPYYVGAVVINIPFTEIDNIIKPEFKN